jgi:hypothetical protein
MVEEAAAMVFHQLFVMGNHAFDTSYIEHPAAAEVGSWAALGPPIRAIWRAESGLILKKLFFLNSGIFPLLPEPILELGLTGF